MSTHLQHHASSASQGKSTGRGGWAKKNTTRARPWILLTSLAQLYHRYKSLHASVLNRISIARVTGCKVYGSLINISASAYVRSYDRRSHIHSLPMRSRDRLVTGTENRTEVHVADPHLRTVLNPYTGSAILWSDTSAYA